jgi:hypothetical protein
MVDEVEVDDLNLVDEPVRHVEPVDCPKILFVIHCFFLVISLY